MVTLGNLRILQIFTIEPEKEKPVSETDSIEDLIKKYPHLSEITESFAHILEGVKKKLVDKDTRIMELKEEKRLLIDKYESELIIQREKLRTRSVWKSKP